MKAIKKWLPLFLATTACSGPPENRPKVVRLAVDETVRPLIEEMTDVYSKRYPKLGFDVRYVPEAEALRLFEADSVRGVVLARELPKSLVKRLKDSLKVTTTTRELAVDGVSPVVHPENPDTALSLAQIRDILTGKIKSWKQLGKRTQDRPIVVVFDHEQSSLLRYAVDSITGAERFGANVYAAGSNAKVLEYVAKNPDALGFVGFNHISKAFRMGNDSTLKVKTVAVAANPQSANDYKRLADYSHYYLKTREYPLTRKLYIAHREPSHGPTSGFVAFASGNDGQLIVHKSGLLPVNVVIRLVELKEGDLKNP
ncbi:MAG: substrate-binding domain-containing protein [Bacteroidia bacterium]|nr:substrate-binding domain-containing protein [Bacteroidia bacterium]